MANKKIINKKEEEVNSLAEKMQGAKLILLAEYRGINVEGPIAVIIGHDDYLEPAKAIYEYTKDHDFYKITGGVVEGKVMTTEEIITLAKLPSRETLIAMLAGGLLGTISKLAVALDQVKMQKENA